MIKLTAKSVTFEQIRALQIEALKAGDVTQAIVCDRALGNKIHTDDYSGGGWDSRELRAARDLAKSMTKSKAIQTCVDTINYARAQAE